MKELPRNNHLTAQQARKRFGNRIIGKKAVATVGYSRVPPYEPIIAAGTLELHGDKMAPEIPLALRWKDKRGGQRVVGIFQTEQIILLSGGWDE